MDFDDDDKQENTPSLPVVEGFSPLMEHDDPAMDAAREKFKAMSKTIADQNEAGLQLEMDRVVQIFIQNRGHIGGFGVVILPKEGDSLISHNGSVSGGYRVGDSLDRDQDIRLRFHLDVVKEMIEERHGPASGMRRRGLPPGGFIIGMGPIPDED